MNDFYVYEHWRLDKNECFYVGKGRGQRAYNLALRNSRHKAIQAKLNRIGSSMEVRIVVQNLTEQQSYDLEVERIAYWRGVGVDLANMTDGGIAMPSQYPLIKKRIATSLKGKSPPNKGKPCSEEQKAKIRAANTGRVLSAATRAKIGAAARNQSEETRARIGAAARARNLGKPPHNKGKPCSEEQRAKLKNPSPELRAKISAAVKIALARRQKEQCDGV